MAEFSRMGKDPVSYPGAAFKLTAAIREKMRI